MVGSRLWESRCTCWQWDGEDVAGRGNGAAHGVDVHDIRDGGLVARGHSGHGVPDLDDVGEVNGREITVRVVEADARQRDNKLLPRIKRRVVGVGVAGGAEAIGVPDLVGGREPGEDDVRDRGQRVQIGRAHV